MPQIKELLQLASSQSLASLHRYDLGSAASSCIWFAMVKKSRGKQRGIQQFSVRKHRVFSRPDTKNIRTSLRVTNFHRTLSRWTEKTWSYMKTVCTKYNLVPFKVNPDNDLWLLCSTKRAVAHYILVTLIVGVVTRNLILSVTSLATYGFNFSSLISLVFFLASCVFAAGIIGSSGSPKETVDLVNGLDAYLEWIRKETGKPQTLFWSTSENIKVIWTVLIFHVSSFDLTVISVVFGGIPTTCFGSVKILGFDPANSFIPADWIWRVIFSPSEFALLIAPGLIAGFNIGTGTLSLGLIRMYCREIR